MILAGPNAGRRWKEPVGREANDSSQSPADGSVSYLACMTGGGFQVPSPGGRIDGASVFGQ